MLLPERMRRPHSSLWLAALAITLLGIAVSACVYVQVDRSSRQDIIDRVATLAVAIPGSNVQALSGSEQDLASPQYQELKTLMENEVKVDHGIRFIYLIGSDQNNELYFYGDSEDPSSPDYSPPGQKYPEATPAMHTFFTNNGQSIAEGPDRDRWGIWISAYAPVRDANGTLIAMLGMDVPAQSYLFDLITYASIPLLLTLLALILLFAGSIRRARKEQLLAQKAEFLSIASHQIRTPLIGIRWAVEQVLASTSSDLNAQDRNILSLTHESSLSLISHVNNLLDVTALEQERLHTDADQSVLMRPLLEEIVSSLELSAKRKNVTITIEDNVPSDLEYAGDRTMLQHIFFNLISNAVKYTRPDTSIAIAYEWTTGGHQFTITDHGLGIAEKDQELIFSGYHRTQQAMESGESGSGLGLYLTKKLVELLKGTIIVRSKVGEGSAFVVTLRN